MDIKIEIPEYRNSPGLPEKVELSQNEGSGAVFVTLSTSRGSGIFVKVDDLIRAVQKLDRTEDTNHEQ